LFKDYTANGQTATLTDLAADDLDDETVHFYWAEGTSVGEGVNCEVTLNLPNLESITAFDAFSVKEIFLHGDKESIGVVKVLDFAGGGDWRIRLGDSPLEPAEGVFFECGVQDNEDGGSWHFVQTVTVGAWATKDGTRVKEKQNGKTVLDTKYPYEPSPFYSSGGWPGKWEADEGVANAFDSPSYPLNTPLDPLTECRVDETFRMYVMYLPPGDESRWVPVAYWTWTWEGNAVKTGATWTPEDLEVTEDPTVSPDTLTNQHPTWTEVYAPEWVNDPGE